MRRILRVLLAAFLGVALGFAARLIFTKRDSRSQELDTPKSAPILEKDPAKPALVDVAKPPDEVVPPQVWVRGYIVRNKQVNVVLSDGRTLTERDGLISRVERNFVDLDDGRRLYLRSPDPAPKKKEEGGQRDEGLGVKVSSPERAAGAREAAAGAEGRTVQTALGTPLSESPPTSEGSPTSAIKSRLNENHSSRDNFVTH